LNHREEEEESRMSADEMEEETSEGEEQEEEDTSLKNQDVLTKYRTSAEAVNKAMNAVLAEIKTGKNVLELCNLGDKVITDEIAKVYTKGKIEKGVAFPTCISVNNCLGHFSPLSGDTTTLAEGDVVKIDMGAHIDGYISTAGHTVVATANPATPTTGRKADIICAAHIASEIVLRLMKPGKKNTDVTEAIKKVAEQFKVESMEGVLSHQMKRYVIDGNKVIINKQTVDQKVDEFEFEDYEVYSVDIVMSTGEGKSRETETRTTIYKRAVDQNYLLKLKTSRYVFNEVNKRFPTLPFTLRSLDEKQARLGITELINHGLVSAYPVLYEKPGEFVAQFKCTVLITPTGTVRLNSFQLPHVTSEFKLEDKELSDLLAKGTKRNPTKKKKKAAKTETKKPGEAMEVEKTS